MTAPDILSKIIAILLDNAVKYSPAKSRVTVVAGASQISIIDQGSGIPEEDLPHIFERFYRAEKSRTSEGFGLGLSLAEKLADKIGVKIEASNHHGADGTVAGAKFTIKL
jgi:two-component system sensor histidine kinase MprB